ncbi:uncharacterized protein P884DRAFT_280492 [Thermothelomyces heterothallicus CBS 202.75]|uniref:uncharacterized protein n=1 Tax=Thermothelomyces heterothallicus CBS 202.75 TaxID=1149848 RepID=UPI003742D15C
MRGVPHEDAQRIIAIERTCSALSFLGCVFVLVTFALSDAFRQRAINRMVFYATFGNMLTNVATLMTTTYTHKPDSFGCQLQGFLIQVFMQSDAYWALAMAINVYLTFYHKYDARMLRRMEIAYLACCYGIPFIPGFTFIFVSNKRRGRPYGDAILWCWLKPEWEVYRIATFYGPIWAAIIATMTIYIRAGREIYHNRRKMMNFSSTGNGTVGTGEHFSPAIEFSSAFNFKTTEVTQTTEIVKPPAAVVKTGATVSNTAPSYSVTVSTDIQAADRLNMRASLEEDPGNGDSSTLTHSSSSSSSTTTNHHRAPSATNGSGRPDNGAWRAPALSTATQPSPLTPTVTSTVTTSRHSRVTAAPGRAHHHHHHHHNHHHNHHHESASSHSATWSYTKCAILFFSVLLITWIPSSGNRVYSLVHRDDVSRPLFYASAFVLPLQGFWNAIIYVVTSWAACKSLARSCLAGAKGVRDWVGEGVSRTRSRGARSGRRVSAVKIVDRSERGGGRAAGAGAGTGAGAGAGGGRRGSAVGIWLGNDISRNERERESERSTSMEDLTGQRRAMTVSAV